MTTKPENEIAPDVPAAEEADAVAEGHTTHSKALTTMPGWLVSTTVHTVLLVILALYTIPIVDTDSLRQLIISTDEDQQSEDLEQFHDEMIEDLNIEVSTEILEVETDATVDGEAELSPVEEAAAATVSVELSEIGLEKAPRSDLMAQVGAFSGNAFSGRGEEARRTMVSRSGGTKGSETAVSNGLKWLARHQYSDGGWSFNHVQSPGCRGRCRGPGTLAAARAAATGMALLPFLGAGQTHIEGKYQKTVASGLKFLKRRIQVTRNGGSFSEPGGMMYSHGIASIAMCEAYAMTKDKQLLVPAQQSINFICYAQDTVGGGWRYVPQSPGDTSVVGWQVMALKSGAMGYLVVPERVLKGAYAFLDAVQFEDGARYGYVSPDEGSPAVTAVGLLCRMYFGWKQGHPALERGVAYIGKLGPTNDIYFNYYATQVMRHWGGEPWKKWNAVMREALVKSQSKAGHESGSWYLPADPHVEQGGRLYCTAMATMILEVYYRHLPIYAKQSTEHEFPID